MSNTAKTVILRREKETKTTVVFKDDSPVPVLPTVYIPKHALHALGNLNTDVVKITLEIP